MFLEPLTLGCSENTFLPRELTLFHAIQMLGGGTFFIKAHSHLRNDHLEMIRDLPNIKL
jgi:hypothetical protein